MVFFAPVLGFLRITKMFLVNLYLLNTIDLSVSELCRVLRSHVGTHFELI